VLPGAGGVKSANNPQIGTFYYVIDGMATHTQYLDGYWDKRIIYFQEITWDVLRYSNRNDHTIAIFRGAYYNGGGKSTTNTSATRQWSYL
jgi:hypothetical protein